MLVDSKYSHWPGCRHFPARFLGEEEFEDLVEKFKGHPLVKGRIDPRGRMGR